MRITLEIAGETYDVDVERNGRVLKLVCEGQGVEARLEGDAIVLDGKPSRVELRNDALAFIDGSPVPFRFAAFTPGSSDAAAAQGGRVPVRAMMPGRIVKLYVRAGGEVAQGQPLLVLEAMKMQNEVASPAAGTVGDVSVKEGDLVEVGRVLAHVVPATRKG